LDALNKYVHGSKIGPLKEVKGTLDKMKVFELIVGPDGRNRAYIGPFGTVTGRNQASTKNFIFGPATWIRGLIRPGEGRAVAYVDWNQQENGIAAKLSGDVDMQEAYLSGDPYPAFAKQVRAVPEDATKESHGKVRGLYKQTVLGVQYGVGAYTLSKNIGIATKQASKLLEDHQMTYRNYWTWVRKMISRGNRRAEPLKTVFGWSMLMTKFTKHTTLGNFQCQGNGADMMRLACIKLVEAGINVCCPVHDAILVEDSIERIDETVARTQAIMSDASALVLNGFRLGSDAKIVRWPDRYMDERGESTWGLVMEILDGLEGVDLPSRQG
jgi:hypothetical protein